MKKVLNVGLMKVNTSSPRHSSIEKTLDIIEKAPSYLDILVGPEWSLMANNIRWEEPYSPYEFRDILLKLRQVSSNSNELLIPGTLVVHTNHNKMYNILPIIYNRNIIFSTIKTSDGGTSFFNNGGYEIIGKDYTIKNSFEWENLKIGVEICADSGNLYRQGKRKLDIQLLVSNGIQDSKLAVKNGGYFLCTDGKVGKGKRTYVIRKRSEKIVDLHDFMHIIRKNDYSNSDKDIPFELIKPKMKCSDMEVYELSFD